MRKLTLLMVTLLVSAGLVVGQNTSEVLTEGDNNTNSVTQTGSNTAYIDQLANSSSATQIQDGSGNDARITQDGKWPEGPVVSETAYQNQSGMNHEARIKQQTDSGHGNSSASQTQSGDGGHYAKAWQFSWNSSIIQTQSGDGTQNWVEAHQKGNHNSITQTQDGVGNVAAVDEQNGWGGPLTGSSITQIQIGKYNHTLVGQYGGHSNDVMVEQYGWDNWAGEGLAGGGLYGVYQSGSENTANITQNDNVNKSELLQDGIGNTATVTQNGGSGWFNDYGDYVNKSNIDQTGDGNTSTVTQTYQ